MSKTREQMQAELDNLMGRATLDRPGSTWGPEENAMDGQNFTLEQTYRNLEDRYLIQINTLGTERLENDIHNFLSNNALSRRAFEYYAFCHSDKETLKEKIFLWWCAANDPSLSIEGTVQDRLFNFAFALQDSRKRHSNRQICGIGISQKFAERFKGLHPADVYIHDLKQATRDTVLQAVRDVYKEGDPDQQKALYVAWQLEAHVRSAQQNLMVNILLDVASGRIDNLLRWNLGEEALNDEVVLIAKRETLPYLSSIDLPWPEKKEENDALDIITERLLPSQSKEEQEYQDAQMARLLQEGYDKEQAEQQRIASERLIEAQSRREAREAQRAIRAVARLEEEEQAASVADNRQDAYIFSALYHASRRMRGQPSADEVAQARMRVNNR